MSAITIPSVNPSCSGGATSAMNATQGPYQPKPKKPNHAEMKIKSGHDICELRRASAMRPAITASMLAITSPNRDVPGRSLQAAVTIPTVAGTTYYVQIGGFPDSDFPFGNLRVSIR